MNTPTAKPYLRFWRAIAGFTMALGGLALPVDSFAIKANEIEHIYKSVAEQKIENCEAKADKAFCTRLFSYLAAIDPTDARVQKSSPQTLPFLAGLVVVQFQPHWVSLCARDTIECRVLRSAVEPHGAGPTRDLCEAMPIDAKTACRELKNYSSGRCASVTEPFLKSACEKKPTSECKKDLACAIAFSFLTGVNETSSPETTAALKVAAAKGLQIRSKLVSEASSLLMPTTRSRPPAKIQAPQGFPFLKLETTSARSARLNPSSKPAQKTSNAPTALQPTFTKLQTFDSFVRLTDLDNLFPWNLAQGMTAADLTGDGRMDLLWAHDQKIHFFENKGNEFKRHEIDLSKVIQGWALTDVSVADLKGSGVPQIVVQQFPGDLILLNWDWRSFSFSVETLSLPVHGITHVIAKSPKGDPRLLITGRQARGSAILDAEANVAIDFDGQKPTISLFHSGKGKATGFSLLPEKSGAESLMLTRGFDGSPNVFGTSDLKRVSNLALPIFATSAGRLVDSSGAEITLIANSSATSPVTKDRAVYVGKPKSPNACLAKNRDRNACLIHSASRVARPVRDLCSLVKQPLASAICLEQINGFTLGEKLPLQPRFVWGHAAYSSIDPMKIDTEWTRSINQLGQIRHIAPVTINPRLQGFLVSEVSHDHQKARRLLWLSKQGTSVKVTDLTPTLPQDAPFDGVNFAVADFDADGHPDIAYRTASSFAILRGNWGADVSGVRESTMQMGWMSRTLSPVPARVSRKMPAAPERK